MAFSPPKQRWQIPITAVDSPAAFDRHKSVVRRIIDTLSEPDRTIIADKYQTKVEISNQLPHDRIVAYWDKDRNTVRLSTSSPDLSQYPEFMKPLLKNFVFIATHELHHPLVDSIAHHAGHYDPAFVRARKRAMSRLHKDRDIGKKVDEATHAMSRFTTFRAHGVEPDGFLKLDYGWNKIEHNNREQLGVLLGVLLSDDYYHAYGYGASLNGRAHDGRYEEILCNVKALEQVYGEANMREFAGELLDYINKLNPHRHTPDDTPPAGKKTGSHTSRYARSADRGGVAVG